MLTTTAVNKITFKKEQLSKKDILCQIINNDPNESKILELELTHAKHAKEWLACRKHGNPEILKFLQNFQFNLFSDQLPIGIINDLLIQQFRQGYCWHFAHLLKQTFQRGDVQLCLPGWQHFVWTDEDGTSYDIDGVFDAIEFGISDNFLEKQYPKYLETFKHRGRKETKVTENLLTVEPIRDPSVSKITKSSPMTQHRPLTTK